MGTKYRTCLVAEVLILALSCTTIAESETEELGVKIERNVPVKMRDGTILRADVHRPDRGGPYPVLVQRTPYGKGGSFDGFVKAGYIVVSQDARGRNDSDGIWESYYHSRTHEPEDGYDTVEWAANLSGSTGKVGTFGISYPASLQWQLAPLRPPSLVAMSAWSIPARRTDMSPGTIRPAFRLSWWAMMAADMRQRENAPGVHTIWEAQKLWQQDSKKWLNWLPWLGLPDDYFGYETKAAKAWLRNFHEPWNLERNCKNISVPNLDVVGWYDHCNGDMLFFRTMVKEARTEVARKGSRIIIGPWGHTGLGQRSSGRIDFGPNADMDIYELRIRWFDYWLKGRQNGVDKEAPVKIFVMGDNKWRDEQYWPLRRTKKKILFMTSDGHANTPGGDGKLVIERPESSNTDTYVYDPTDPVPTPYGARRPRATDQRSLANRDDILVYQTELLTERVEVTGNPMVELYASSSAPDTDWFVRLIDVHPDGFTRDVSSGMVRARYRNGFDKPKLINSDEVVKYIIRMNPTSNAFLSGHRIRLDITSSDFPNYDRNHNTVANQNADVTLAVAKQTIYYGGNQTTRIILPWVPNTKEDETLQTEITEQNTQLHEAADEGDIERVKSLISQGADVNGKDSYRRTPAERAIGGNHREVVELLVAKGAEISTLHLAAYMGNLAKAESTIENGADVNESTQSGTTALLIAVSQGLKDIVELLIDSGADVNAKGPWSWTPLHSATESGQKDLAGLLIASGANVNTKDGGYWTPLHYALWEGHTDVAKLLVKKGAKVNMRGFSGHSTLHWAVRNRDKERMENILAANIMNVNTRNGRGQTPLHMAISRGFTDGAKLLIAKGAEIDPKDNDGMTPLNMAASMGSKDVVKLLMAKGTKVDERDDNYEFTALHYAARFGNKNVAEVLITNSANIKAKDKWDYQPIHWAAYHDRADVVELLISKGADIRAKTSLGQTALQLAQERRNTKTVELLQKHGAKE